MASTSQQLLCRICGESIDAATLRMHLRWVHQVAQGERTLADIPVARATVPAAVPIGERRPSEDREVIAV